MTALRVLSDADLRPAPGTPLSPEAFFRRIGYVTLKVTNGCNLKCSYCNVEADHPKTPRMSMDVFRRVTDLLIENSPSPKVGLEFHGGEPLLMPIEWFEEAVGYAKQKADAHGKIVEHPLMTNGTMLRGAKLDALLRLGIQIGFSLDGPPHINDRKRQGGLQTVAAMERLRSRGLGYGVIVVLSRANCADMSEVMDFFAEKGVRDYRVNFIQPQGHGRNEHLLTGDELFIALRDIFEHMWRTGCSVIEGDVEKAVHRFVQGRRPNPPLNCWDIECQAGRTYCAVNHLGDVFACGTDMSQHKLGNVYADFDQEHMDGTLKRLHRQDPWYARCFGCEARPICHHSCPTSDYNDLSYREHECDFTKRLFAYFQQNARRVHEVDHMLWRARAGGQGRRGPTPTP